MALTIGGTLGGLHRRDIRDVAVVANRIVVDEVADFLNKTVVANGDIAQRGIVDARMLGKACGYLDHLFEDAQTDITIEYYSVEIIGTEVLSHFYSVPIFSPTAVIL